MHHHGGSATTHLPPVATLADRDADQEDQNAKRDQQARADPADALLKAGKTALATGRGIACGGGFAHGGCSLWDPNHCLDRRLQRNADLRMV
jgi:hypothetical protein